MKNEKIKVLYLDPNFINRWGYLMGYLMRDWQIIFNQRDKHLSKLLPHFLRAGVHFLKFLNA